MASLRRLLEGMRQEMQGLEDELFALREERAVVEMERAAAADEADVAAAALAAANRRQADLVAAVDEVGTRLDQHSLNALQTSASCHCHCHTSGSQLHLPSKSLGWCPFGQLVAPGHFMAGFRHELSAGQCIA